MELGSAERLLERARRRGRRGDIEGARADLALVVAAAPQDARLHLIRALVLIELGERRAARDDVARAAELGADPGAPALPDWPGLPALRGWLALYLDADPRGAERHLTTAVDGGDRHPSTLIARGWARHLLRDHDGALADARSALRAAPGNPDARLLLGLARIYQGDDGGLQDLDRAEARYAAAGDARGQVDVWRSRADVRQGRTPLPGGPRAWLWFGPDEPRGAGSGPGELQGAGSGPDELQGAAVARRGRRIPGGRLTLLAVFSAVRTAIGAAALATLTAVLPGLEAGPPVARTMLLAVLLHRVLLTGLRSLLAPLAAAVPPPVRAWTRTGPAAAVGLVRWAGAALTAALALAVTGWTATWLGLDYRVADAATAAAAGAVLGLGTFVGPPAVRRSSDVRPSSP